MTEAFPEAMVTGYEHLEATVNSDPKDRHVLAAAVAAGADALVTVNLRDFPTDEMDRLEIDVLHPEQFLFQVWSLDIDAVRAALLRDATRRVRPPTICWRISASLPASFRRWTATTSASFASYPRQHSRLRRSVPSWCRTSSS